MIMQFTSQNGRMGQVTQDWVYGEASRALRVQAFRMYLQVYVSANLPEVSILQ